jgi:SH2 domain-containing protein
MSRIAPAAPTSHVEWTQRKQQLIKLHPAWYVTISEHEAEKLLQNQLPFTYLLRQSEQEPLYFISFLKEDGSIKHQFFVLEYSRLGWYYRNGGTGGPQEIVADNLNELIPKMMHCDPLSCIPLQRM